MTIGQLKRWLKDNGIPDDWPLCVATFARTGGPAAGSPPGCLAVSNLLRCP